MPLSRAFFYTLLGVPKKKKDLLIKQNLTFLSNSPIKEPLSLFFQRGPYGERCHWLIHSFTSLRVPS